MVDGSTTGSGSETGSGSVADTSSSSGSTSTTSSSSSGDTTEGTGTTGLGDCHPLIVEVFYDAPGGDDQLQWIKLYNPCSVDIDLTTWTIGYGGADYVGEPNNPRLKPLQETIAAGQCYVIGGPTSDAANGMPVYDVDEDFAPGLDTAQQAGGGVALFDMVADEIEGTTVPLDAVVYGPNNDNGLIDASGQPVSEPHVANPPADSGGSIRRTSEAATWEIAAQPTPAACPPF